MKFIQKCSLIAMIIAGVTCEVYAQSLTIFSNKNEEKIEKLIREMTLEEKIYQLGAYYYGRSEHSNANVRLGIPNLVAGESLHGAMADGATVFPIPIAMASSWDTNLIERMGHVVAKETRAFGIHQGYAPMIAVVRDTRWGRIEESYGEDPFLVGSIGTAYVKGLQGMGLERFDKNHIIACSKHFVADGEPMAGANGAAMDVSDYNLQNIHLYPFRMTFEEAKVASIMPAHHLLNGVPCHANTYILNDILRKQYGWDGWVVSDNQDLPRLVNLFHYAPDFETAAIQALQAGVHQELDLAKDYSVRVYGKELIESVKKGRVPEHLIDETVAMNLRVKFELGLFDTEKPDDQNYVWSELGPPLKKNQRLINPEVVNNKQHDELALKVAQKSIILLKNENNALPLNISQLKKIAVIGPNANAVRIGGYSPKKLKYYVTVLEGIKNYVGNSAEVNYAEGAAIDSEQPSGEDESKNDIELTRYAEKSKDSQTPEDIKIAEAVMLAQNSDVVVLVIGGSEATCRENEDTDYLGLRGKQLDLVKAVYDTGKPCVVVMLGGRPLSINWIAEHIPAVIQGWYLGQETGTAIADVLFGKVNPGGKLPVTIPRNVGQVPLFYNKLEPGRTRKIYRSPVDPLFPFGYGLSYTTFDFKNLQVEKTTISVGEKTTLSVDVTNTGKVTGEEVVQLYIHALNSKRVRPSKELRGFQRIALDPGETKTVRFEIGKKQLEYWNEDWVVEPGEYELFIANDSSDQKLGLNKTTIKVKN